LNAIDKVIQKERRPQLREAASFFFMGNPYFQICLWIGLSICAFQNPVLAQKNLSGKNGLIYIPTAVASKDGDFSFGYNYNPIEYALRGKNKYAEQILFANLDVLPRLQVSFLLLQQRKDGKRKTRDGIGDRQLDIRYQILKEGKYKPALALILSSPFTIDAALQTHVLVATKTLKLTDFSISPTLGIGSPYYLYRPEKNLNNGDVFSSFTWQKKSEDRYKNNYLTGVFGGVKCSYQDKISLLAEWDGQKMNTGIAAKFFKKLETQVCVLNFDKLYVGASYTVNLKASK
jgi:hypothetical protein